MGKKTRKSAAYKNKRNSKQSDQCILSPGDKVIIRQNPHYSDAVNVIGTVIIFRPNEGFGNCDLVDVHYKHPRTQKCYTLPFGLSCLDGASTEK